MGHMFNKRDHGKVLRNLVDVLRSYFRDSPIIVKKYTTKSWGTRSCHMTKWRLRPLPSSGLTCMTHHAFVCFLDIVYRILGHATFLRYYVTR